MMGRQVQQLGRLVDDLLDLSRIARGKMQLRMEWVDLGQAVRRAAEASRPLVEARRHELTVSLPASPVRLRGRPDPPGASPDQPAQQRRPLHPGRAAASG